MPWHTKRTAILFKSCPSLGFIGVCDIFFIVLCPFIRFPSARLGVFLISICDINCDMEVRHITVYFLSCFLLFHGFCIFDAIYIRNTKLSSSAQRVYRVLFVVDDFSVCVCCILCLYVCIYIKSYTNLAMPHDVLQHLRAHPCACHVRTKSMSRHMWMCQV